jgi:uncharacterized protein
MYTRSIQEKIEKWLFKEKIIILYGARQVGKTTLAQALLKKYKERESAYYNCEDPIVQNALTNKGAQELKNFFGNKNFIVLDEAQTLLNIGRILKIFHDSYPQVQILATGSSSFDLSNKINEPLTGRSLEFILYPLSIKEIHNNQDSFFIHTQLKKFLIYGMYPEIINKDNNDSFELLTSLSTNYLFKDILNFEGIKNSNLIYKILQALSYQIGNQVSYTELANTVGSNKNTVERYIDILEKSFIIFRLSSFSRNKRNEICKSRKIFFYDIGIRNALIQNFNNIDLRNDIGAIWENFIITEILKNERNNRSFAKIYFWRSYSQQEIDLIVEKNDHLELFEMKWNPNKKSKVPSGFHKNYTYKQFSIINKDNFIDYLIS